MYRPCCANASQGWILTAIENIGCFNCHVMPIREKTQGQKWKQADKNMLETLKLPNYCCSQTSHIISCGDPPQTSTDPKNR
jgi:hypothetical protein